MKGNYARLLWEDCRLEGMNDDSFNIATHSSRIVEVLSPKSVRIRQNFPLGFVPFKVGDMLVAYDVVCGKLLGKARVASALVEEKVDKSNPDRPAPLLRLTLDHSLDRDEERRPGLEPKQRQPGHYATALQDLQ